MNNAKSLSDDLRHRINTASQETTLEPGEQLFWATFNSSSAAQIITELDMGRVLEVNEAYCRLVGYPRSALLGHSTPELHIWLDLEEREEVLRELQRSGHLRDKEFKIRTSTGTVRAQLASFKLFEVQGKTCVVSSTIDISERKQAEIELRRSEEQYRGLIKTVDSVIAAVDYAGRVLYMNDLAAASLGRPAAELIGSTLPELFPGPVGARQLESVRKVIRTDQGNVTESQGVIRGALRWYRTSIQPIHDEHGRVVYALINSTDIHDLKQAQQDLLELNRTLEERINEGTAEVQDLYDNAPAGYHSLDAHGRFVRVNQTELNWLGYTREEVLGRRFTDFVTPASQAVFRATFPRFLAQGSICDLEFDLVRHDGTTMSVLVNATAICDPAGRYRLSRSTIFDNSARKQAEDALRLANVEMEHAVRIKDEFLANMSHELRTPLTGMLALGENLQELVYGPLNERQLKALAHIETSSRHLLSLINDLLDLSKIEAGRLDLELQPAAVDDITQASLLFVKEIAHKKNIQLFYHNDQPHALVVADARRLKQMLVNLLGNAVKFTPDGGQVHLRVTPDADAQQIRFAVQDTGVGIAPEAQARLFQPFTQLDSTLARQYEGSGLGLALVKRLAAQHGGSVTVASTGIPGEGSCFTITLPYTVG